MHVSAKVREALTKNQHLADCRIAVGAQLSFMIANPPRHSHRTPAELADAEILAALRGEQDEIPPSRRWLLFDTAGRRGERAAGQAENWLRDGGEASEESSPLTARSLVRS